MESRLLSAVFNKFKNKFSLINCVYKNMKNPRSNCNDHERQKYEKLAMNHWKL